MNDKTKPAETKPTKTKPAKTKPAALWEQTKAWADKNRTISGALLGGAAGTIAPGIGHELKQEWGLLMVKLQS